MVFPEIHVKAEEMRKEAHRMLVEAATAPAASTLVVRAPGKIHHVTINLDVSERR